MESVLVVKNAREQEEVFYAYKFGEIMQMGGHYIYYEKKSGDAELHDQYKKERTG